jgi:hypothetical protein
MRSAYAVLTLLGVAACGLGDSAKPASQPPDPEATTPFVGDPPSVYVAKVKNVLVGLPPTDDEVQAVEQDPAKLRDLVDGWMKLPEYETKMRRFFQLAFQQTQVSITDFADQAFPRQASVNASVQPLLLENATESFARTAFDLVTAGRPFTETVTTESFMMTPALMELYAFFDAWHVDDAGQVADSFRIAHPKLALVVEAAQGPIPIADSLDPKSANYMHWYNPDLANPAVSSRFTPGCAEDPITIPATGIALHFIMHGSLEGHLSAGGTRCQQFGGSAAAPQLVASDFTTWKKVTIRRPRAGEKPTPFWDLATLRSSSELVTVIPRVGFFSTPAFFANWPTNISNQMRVTVNQALIVATGAAIDGNDTTTPPSTPGLDATHADPKLGCLGCHQLLDPTRSILAATYTWNYHDQTDPTWTGVPGLFAFQGVVKPVTTIGDFAQTLATHPAYARAWAQKLCYYVDSGACSPDDPELARIVSLFQSSGWSWSVLVKEIFSSPLVTHAARTKTLDDTGGIIAVSRRDHLCAAWNARLGLDDVCGLDAQKVAKRAQTQTVIPAIVSGLPSDGYGRGAAAPVLPNAPSLFYRAGTENICEVIADAVVDPAKPAATQKSWSSAAPDAAIDDFVRIVMGMPSSDARFAAAKGILSAHFHAAVGTGVSTTDALKSTFVIACTAPSATAIGL